VAWASDDYLAKYVLSLDFVRLGFTQSYTSQDCGTIEEAKKFAAKDLNNNTNGDTSNTGDANRGAGSRCTREAPNSTLVRNIPARKRQGRQRRRQCGRLRPLIGWLSKILPRELQRKQEKTFSYVC
jgi:hypothetical protein